MNFKHAFIHAWLLPVLLVGPTRPVQAVGKPAADTELAKDEGQQEPENADDGTDNDKPYENLFDPAERKTTHCAITLFEGTEFAKFGVVTTIFLTSGLRATESILLNGLACQPA